MAKATKTRQAGRTRAKAKGPHPALDGFLPCVARWFDKTFDRPSPAQVQAWPVIRRGDSTLLLAPTGSGKTLAAFLCAIDDLFRRGERDELTDGVHVLYITPLKALGNDIHKNLVEPLAGIRRGSRRQLPEIRMAVRSGDTPQADRARMIRHPPHILITTPESLYLLLQSKRMRPNLRTIRTVIVDEVHALCDNKRGVHLAVSLERLAELVDAPVQRVGCSATLSPLDRIAAFLVGFDEAGQVRPCTIVNAGMRKGLDVEVMAPLPDFLEAGHTALWSSAYELLLGEVARHDTTLVFTNSRYKAERTSLRLNEQADPATRIGAHHGSMSKETRLEAEDALKAGRLDALVATASLELGIDIGSIDLVYQLESPKSVATGLQRIGRAGHLLDATSKGRVLVFERDELLEAGAICNAMIAGEVDAVRIPRGCLDVLAQQIVGAVAAGDCDADELFALVRRAYPYAQLPRSEFDAVLGMVGGEHPFDMARAPRALVLWDRATGRLTAARAAAHVSAMCVGTIPESAEYDVVIEGNRKRVGRVQSEFVDDCLRIGDVFVLGSSSWKVTGVRKNQLIVQEAPGATPTVPWWHGPVESRTVEAGMRVGVLRREIAQRLHDPDLPAWLAQTYHLCPDAATAAIDYVREQTAAAGFVPDHQRLLVETWKDELGRFNVIVHSPYGERINRTWGVAMATAARRELGQVWSVCASNDILLLSLADGNRAPRHPPDARALVSTVTPRTVSSLVVEGAQGAVRSGSAFRDTAGCALQVLRAWQGRRVPLWLQNHRADELYEAAGDCPDYPVVAEVLRSYVCDSLDAPGLERLLGRIDASEVGLVYQDVDSPSPFAHALLVQDRYRGDHQMGRSRRAHLLRLHRQVLKEVLSAEQMAQLLDGRAIDRLERRLGHRSETTRARSVDELAQIIHDLGDMPATIEAVARVVDGDAADMLDALVAAGRVVAVGLPDDQQDPVRLVAPDLWRQYHDALVPGRTGRKQSVLVPRIDGGTITGFDDVPVATLIPARWRKKQPQADARRAVVERYLRCRGPMCAYEIANHTGWPMGEVEGVLAGLVDAGTVARGVYTGNKPRPQWVNKANLEEIHRLTLGYLRRELAACAPYEVVDFMTRWQHRHPDTRVKGLDGLRQVIAQLQGIEVMQGALETEVLPARVADYRPEMLDRLAASGEVCWCRLGIRRVQRGRLTLCLRKDMPWLTAGAPVGFDVEGSADADIPDVIRAVRDHFRTHRMAFFDEVVETLRLDEGAVMRAVWYLAWCGELTCDTYECVRHADFQSTLSACYDLGSTPRKIVSGRISAESVVRRMRKRKLDPRLGRWWATERLVPPKKPVPHADVVRRWADLLLKRWGIVSKDILAHESGAPPWGELVREFKRLELLGQVSRGYFIEGHVGEQYGLPEAIELLRDCRARRSDGHELGYLEDEPVFIMTNRDPANLYTLCLDMIEERGQRFDRAPRQGNLVARLVVQAGQVLLRSGWQLTTLTRWQLVRCIELLKYNCAGRLVERHIGRWNGHPIDAHPVAGLLYEQGFRFDKRGHMRWPASGAPTDAPLACDQEVFRPYYAETPVQYGPEWALGRAPAPVRPALKRLLDVLLPELEARGWGIGWSPDRVGARYSNNAWMWVRAAKSFVDIVVRTRTLRFEGRTHRIEHKMRVVEASDVNDPFVAELRQSLTAVQSLVDRFDDVRKKKEKTMGENIVMINRAPVLTLWAAVVAERMGHDRDAALTLGKCVAGLNAQTKGRRLGIYGPPKGPERGGPPKKVGLGEEFWLEICGRPVPAKNTPEGVRAVIKDKPIDPAGVETYLKSKFKESLEPTRDAMAALAGAFEPDALEGAAFELYEQFRPVIDPGRRGWGQKGRLDLDLIRSLATE